MVGAARALETRSWDRCSRVCSYPMIRTGTAARDLDAPSPDSTHVMITKTLWRYAEIVRDHRRRAAHPGPGARPLSAPGRRCGAAAGAWGGAADAAGARPEGGRGAARPRRPA